MTEAADACCAGLAQDVYDRQVAQLVDLIDLINTDLTRNDRKKLITLCTIDVHARDVVQRLIDERVNSAAAFQWQSQLRYAQHEKTKECQVGVGLRGLNTDAGPVGQANATFAEDRCTVHTKWHANQ